MKKLLSVVLILVIVLSLILIGTISTSAENGVKSKLDAFIERYPNGSRWTNSFDGGIQCYGFGKLVIYNIFGKSNVPGYTYRTWKYDGTSSSGMNVVGSITNYSSSNVKSLLSKAKPGDILQFNTTKQHTMIVYDVVDNGVWIYDCNWDNNCGISLRKSSFGAWNGRNSTKLTLLRADNYSVIDASAHKINSSYGTNFTAYPKAKITATNIFDANHAQISSTAWIGTSDKCTIHEVYTDGCCKVSYPLDSGGTKTAYSKISLFTLPTLSIKYDANGGAISDTSKYYLNSSGLVYKSSSSAVFVQKMVDGTTYDDGLYNYTTLGISRTGYTFKGWGTTSSGGTIYSQSEAMTAKKLYSSISKGNATITMYAIWEPNTLKVYYNANGSSIDSDTYKLSSNLVYNKSDGSKYYQSWTYNNAKTNGLVNKGTFGLYKTGYTFGGWGTTSSGGTVYSADDTTLKPTTLNSNIKNGSCTTTLYAVWNPNTLTVHYNANGGIIDSEKYVLINDYICYKDDNTAISHKFIYNTPRQYGLADASTCGLSKPGYKFLGWSTTADASTKVFDQSDASVVATDLTNTINTSNCTLDVYAIWEKERVEEPTEQPDILLGDVDDDSKVSIVDATVIQRHVAQLAAILENKFSCADTDKDGKIAIMDATIIQRFIAQIIPSL